MAGQDAHRTSSRPRHGKYLGFLKPRGSNPSQLTQDSGPLNRKRPLNLAPATGGERCGPGRPGPAALTSVRPPRGDRSSPPPKSPFQMQSEANSHHRKGCWRTGGPGEHCVCNQRPGSWWLCHHIERVKQGKYAPTVLKVLLIKHNQDLKSLRPNKKSPHPFHNCHN